jgi:hypothetical protein
VAEYLVIRHEGAHDRARVEYGLAVNAVREWYPARTLGIEAAIALTEEVDDINAVASLGLAESLEVPLVTKNADLRSRRVPVLYC